MNKQPFTIELFLGSALLRIAVQGFWSEQTVELFKQSVADAELRFSRFGSRAQGLKVLIDARAMKVQGQDVMHALEHAFVGDRAACRDRP